MRTRWHPLFQALYNADADVVLGGHAHDYERFAPQNPSAGLDNARGIRQFVVGSGGAFWTSIGTPKPNSQVRQNNTYGVLKLTLHPTTYDWQFVPEAGKTFTDSGTGACHGSTPPPTDTTKPSVPGNLRATPGPSQVALQWNASTDNVAVTGYNVYRGTTMVATAPSTATSWTDTALAPGSYTYTVRATDAAANLSDPSNAVTATVLDTVKPTVPTNVTATVGPKQVALSWNASTDNVGVTGYRVLRGGVQVGTSAGNVTTYTDSNLAAGTYSYTVVAVDAAANASDPSTPSVSATVPDTTKPSAPGNLQATGGIAKVDLTWQTSTDDVGVTGYRVLRNGAPVATIGVASSYQDHPAPGTYSYTVRAVDAAGNLSDDSNTANATVPDVTKPTPPGALSATGSASQVALNWQASQDDVGVNEYRVYRGATRIATVGGTTLSFTDTPLAAGSYTYTVRAADAANNESDPSNTATGVVPDTTKPDPPGNLVATGGLTQVDLSWQPSADDVGVTGYRVYRNGTHIVTVTSGTFYQDHPLPGTYSYTVRAVDAAVNLSDESNTATATVPDVTKPTAPGNLTAHAANPGQIDLAWQASTDNIGVTGYDIYRDDQPYTSVGPNTTSYSDGVLAPATHTYVVRARDAAGNQSDPSNSATESVVPPDNEKPAAPGNLAATLVGTTGVDLAWDASTDNRAVTGYVIQRNGAVIATIAPATTWSDTAVPPGDYDYEVLAFDAADNISDPSNTASVNVPDVEAPTAPGNLTATAVGSTHIDLDWDASQDNVAVTGYDIYRDTLLYTSVGPTVTSYSDGVLAPATHSYVVRARDAAAHESDPSNTATATVLPPDIVAPSAPGNLHADLNGAGRVDLGWDPSLDDRAVTGYRIYRNGIALTDIGPVTSYSDTNLAPQHYTYTVTALDAAGNESDPSGEAGVTVPDVTKPSPPGNLAASSPSAGRVDLTWQASSDNVAVTGYDVYREGTRVATLGVTTSFSETGLALGTYHYVVRAVDAATNASDPSNEAIATVPDSQRPAAPGNVTATPMSPTQVDLTWQAATDNVGVTGYRVLRGSNPVATLGAVTSWSDTGLAPNTGYSYQVQARDAAGNWSDLSTPAATATTPAASATFTFAPVADAKVSSSAATTNYATTNLRADGGTNPAVESVLRFTVTGAPAGSVRTAKLRVYAYTGTVDGPAVFTTNPAWTETAINWNNRPPHTSANTDDKGNVPANTWVEYDVTSFVTGDGTYSFGLSTTSSDGIDLYSREAATLRPELVVTTGAPDTQKPFPPPNLSATVRSASQVDLAWQPATDNVGVTGYRVFRNGNPIATLGVTTAYSDTTVAANSTYTYDVRAMDGAGLVSDPSNTQTVTTPRVATVVTISPEADARVQEANRHDQLRHCLPARERRQRAGRRDASCVSPSRASRQEPSRPRSCASTTTTARRTAPRSTRPTRPGVRPPSTGTRGPRAPAPQPTTRERSRSTRGSSTTSRRS